MGIHFRTTVSETLSRMKIIISLVVAVVVLGYSEAQFGGFSAAQNCVGSNCNQNNFGRKRRQILEEILSEVEAEEELAREVTKREAEADLQGFGSVSFSATQNCAGGSNCNQNNFGRKKREIAAMIESLTSDLLEADAVNEEEKNVDRETREAEAQPQFGSFSASQNCVGSSCNQNNFGRKKRAVIAALLEELL